MDFFESPSLLKNKGNFVILKITNGTVTENNFFNSNGYSSARGGN